MCLDCPAGVSQGETHKAKPAILAGRRTVPMNENVTEINYTLTALSRNFSEISAETLEIALNRTLEEWRADTFSCPVFGKDLNTAATATLADLLYRSGESPRCLAAIVAGQFGEILTNGMIASIYREKNQRRGEIDFEKRRRLKTKFSVQRNYFEEKEPIRAIALGIIFGAQHGVEILFPEKVEPAAHVGFYKSRNPYFITACSQNWETELVFFANINDREKLEKLRAICRHNRRQETSETLECVTVPTLENRTVEKLYGERFPGIGTRCLSFRKVDTNKNPIIGAFSCAAYNFLKFEIGVGKAQITYETSELNQNRDKRDIDLRVMLPMMMKDYLLKIAADDLDRMIVEVAAGVNFGGYSISELHREIHRIWNHFGGSTPPAYMTVKRRHERMFEIVKSEFSRD